MKLGEKIRTARLNAGMTQSQLAGDFITRNMLSQIENGLAMPSLQTALYIADKLGIDAGILFSDGDNKNAYFVTRKLPLLKKAFADNDIDKCIELCTEEGEDCDEAILILAECYIKKAYEHYKQGRLRFALRSAESANKYAQKSFYSSDSIKFKYDVIETMVCLASPFIKQSKRREDEIKLLREYYIETSGQKALFNKHSDARKLIDEKKYEKAASIIKSLLKERNLDVPFIYNLCCDLEICYREMKDFENAYDVSQKAKDIFNDMQQ